ncbi:MULTISPECIES: lantibiotic dehydratase [Lysinibacillus]|uniref:lantibiotic dehydratase n=1 Tax=Lysinibacillus TaxID=400634 RepID=UPI00237DF8DD|nr:MULTISPECIES: lantibiotic dehydratase [Lysinibacillus]WDU79255.1 lantibiotic dehydratase [Lysinibacillus sp. G01H]
MLFETLSIFEEIKEVEERLEEIRGAVEAILFRLVSELKDEHTFRRTVLSLKRDVFNQRKPKATEESIHEILNFLPKHEQSQVKQWLESINYNESLRLKAQSTFKDEVDRASKKMAHYLENDDLKKGILLSSQSFMSAYKPGDLSQFQLGEGISKTSTSYLTRSIMKTSPFSTFTKLGVSLFSKEANDLLEDMEERSYIQIYQPIVYIWTMAIAMNTEFGQLFLFEGNRGINDQGDQPQYLVGDYRVQGNFAAKTENLKMLHDVSLVKLVRNTRKGSREQWVEALKDFGGLASFTQLLKIGLIRPIFPYESNEKNPLSKLVGILKKLKSKNSLILISKLENVNENIQKLGRAKATERFTLLKAISEEAKSIFQALNISIPKWFDKGGFVYEDVSFHKRIPHINPAVQLELEKYGETFTEKMIHSHYYDVVKSHFIERFGIGGTCEDVFEFLCSIMNRSDVLTFMSEAGELNKQSIMNKSRNGKRHKLSSSSVPPATVFNYQIAAKNQVELDKGNFKIIVNHSSSGLGNIFYRFLPLFNHEGEALSDHLLSWISGLVPDAEPVLITYGADWNNIQIVEQNSERCLIWPSDTMNQVDRQRSLLLEDITIQHHAIDDTLVILGPEGKPLAPIYTGTIPNFLLPPLLKLFLILSNPWINGNQTDWSFSEFGPQYQLPKEIEYYPRIEEGRMVMRRARWRIPLHMFPFKQHHESDFTYFLRVNGWRRENHLPEEAFFCVETNSSKDLDPKKRKPIYVHFGSPHTLEVIQSYKKTNGLSFALTEVFPSREEHWISTAKNEFHATEFLSLCKWGC